MRYSAARSHGNPDIVPELNLRPSNGRRLEAKASLHVAPDGVIKSDLSPNLPVMQAEITLVFSVLGAKINEILSDDA